MRLLITTQAVDLDDPVLAFFHRWIEEFAKNCERVEVICLKEGRHALPANVSVYSLGKEKGVSRAKYIVRFLRYVTRMRRDYDAVFVHMNPEYLALAGPLWRLWGKRVGLWYIHPRASRYLRVAMRFAHHIFSATDNSFPCKTSKLLPVGVGIDTRYFSPLERAFSAELRIMSAARISPVKRVECMIDATKELVRRDCPILFDYFGTELPRDARYAEVMRKKAETISVWTFRGHAKDIRTQYQSHDVHVNATDTGSFDKAVIESMACGCIAVVSNRAFHGILPREVFFEEGSAVSLADALERITHLPQEDKKALAEKMREIAVAKYDVAHVISKVVHTYLT